MKTLKLFLFTAVLAIGSLALVSCGGSHSHDHGDGDATEMQGKEYTSAYVCPMHCDGSGSDEAGTCPECGMDYVKNEEHTEDEHSHDGHSH